jgi:lactate dehydrogenase-like 2-hydroxyacid dehydrogenase
MRSKHSLFEQIVCVDKTGLTSWGMGELQNLSIRYSDSPSNDSEIIDRIKDADCVLVSWDTAIGAHVLRASPRFFCVCMCCSLYDERSGNVAITAAGELGITVHGIRNYGDEGLVIYLCRTHLPFQRPWAPPMKN